MNSLIGPRSQLARMACATAAALAFTLAACGEAPVSHFSPDHGDLAIVLADQIVTGMASSYADRHYDGKQRAFAVDLSLFDDVSLLGDTPHAHAPKLEDGLRRVAETLEHERAAWILRFWPVEAHPDISGVASIYADVIDLLAEHCCVIEVASLERDDEGGWRVIDIGYGGHAEESKDFRRDRLARGSELLKH